MNEGISITIEPMNGPPKSGPSPRLKYPMRQGQVDQVRGKTLREIYEQKSERNQSNG